MMITSCHTNACFEAWMKCEAVLVNMTGIQTSLSKKFTQIIDECALICMSTFHALKIKSVNVSRFAILCIGICEMRRIVRAVDDENYKQCASTCRQCSQTMTSLA